MKTKIFEALKTKFAGVDAQILDRIAAKKAEGVTDESKITSIVDGVSFQDVLQSYGDFRAGDASSSAVKNYERKHNLKDGKTVETPPVDPPQPPTNPKPDDMATLIANAVSAAVKPLSEKLSGFEEKEAMSKRNADIFAKAKEYGIPESQAKRYNIPKDADLDEYFKDAKQELANLGFKDVKAPESTEAEIKKEGEAIAGAINAQTKEIVEQTKK
ncbi:MAG: hypothetical protein LBV32_03215 [Tannerellaceae bacterium]|jgi:hypothetical protein|nr:hypothetical protein [Tannerellaceae bacterium]